MNVTLAAKNEAFTDPVFWAMMAIAGTVLGLVILIERAVKHYRHWSLKYRFRKHFGVKLDRLTVVSRDFMVFDLPNLKAAIDAFVAQHQGTLEEIPVVGLDLRNLNNPHAKRASPIYQDIDIDVNRRASFLTNGLYLLHIKTQKLAILLHNESGHFGGRWRASSFLQVLAVDKDYAAECIGSLRKLLREVSIYRGRIISLEGGDIGHDEQGFSQIQFHEVPHVDRDQIVLQPDTMRIIERNTIRFFQKAHVLRSANQSIKRGLLFYGPPGTGKTWTARWLTHSLPKVTVILVTGEKLWNIKESCRLARMLAPAMVILEDVDLIALSRETTLNTTPLHELMNEMDGLDSDTEVLFLLTTNRPDALEPALAARPGRIDQAILFPLPDADCRRRLVLLYGQGLDLQLQDLPHLVKRTDGASPAFIKELVRKAALIATDDHADGAPQLRVNDTHFDLALQEMTRGDSDLTGKLLGFYDLMT